MDPIVQTITDYIAKKLGEQYYVTVSDHGQAGINFIISIQPMRSGGGGMFNLYISDGCLQHFALDDINREGKKLTKAIKDPDFFEYLDQWFEASYLTHR